MAADPKASLGARQERTAFRNHLRRQLSIEGTNSDLGKHLEKLLAWVLKRQARYDKAAGGLGKR